MPHRNYNKENHKEALIKFCNFESTRLAYSHSEYDEFDFNPVTFEKEKTKIFDKGDDELEEWLENIFLERWNKPNQWDNFTINLNNEYKIDKIESPIVTNVSIYLKN